MTLTATGVRVEALALRRELGHDTVALLLGAAAAAVAVAHLVSAGLDAGPSLFDRALRRFDLTLLYFAAATALFRVAARIEQDERALWLDSFVAAGASRARYLLGVAAGAVLSSVSLFAVTAIIYAASVSGFSASRELFRELPCTLAGGSLLLLHWCAWIALFGTLLRRALPAFLCAVLSVLAPFTLLTVQLQRTGAPDAWLVWVVRLSPPLVPATDLRLACFQLGAASALAALSCTAAARLLGRHA